MKQLILIPFLMIVINTFSQSSSIELFFQSDVSTLTQTNKLKIDTFIDSNKGEEYELLGQADATGNKEYNLKLSEKRAQIVKKYLLAKNISENFITISSIGEENANENDIDFRKVTLRIFKNIDIKNKEIESTTTIKDFYSNYKDGIQNFCINNGRDTTIRGKLGTIIHIKAKSFNTNSTECINFQLKEVFDKSEMILENLSTTSNGQILETQGMIYTNALLSKDTLKLEKDLTIIMPTDEIKQDMQLFDGKRDPHSDVMNWSLSNNSVLRNFTIKDLVFCPDIQSKKGGSFYDCCKENICYSLCMAIDSTSRYTCNLKLEAICKSMKCEEKCSFFFCQLGVPFSKKNRDKYKSWKWCKKRFKNIKRQKDPFKNTNTILRNFIRPDALKEKIPLTKKEKEIIELANNIAKADNLIKNGYVNKEMIQTCKKMDSLITFYGVDNAEELIYFINKPLMDEFGVTSMKELIDTIPKANLSNIEMQYRNKNISFDDYKFYIFNSSKLGWKNCDIFANIAQEDFINLKVNLIPNKTNDCKLVFKEREFVLPAQINSKFFYFKDIPKNENAWIVALKYENGKPFLALQKIYTESKTFNLEFEQLELDQLKQKLKIIDFK